MKVAEAKCSLPTLLEQVQVVIQICSIGLLRIEEKMRVIMIGLRNQVKTVLRQFTPANYMNYLKKVEKSLYILVGHSWEVLIFVYLEIYIPMK
jgi:hypothetical protein